MKKMNFEAFHWNISLSADLLFLKSVAHDPAQRLYYSFSEINS